MNSPYSPEITLAGQLVSRTAKINPSAETMEAWLDKGVYRDFIDKNNIYRETIRFYTYHNAHKIDETYQEKLVWEESQEHVMRSATTPEEFAEWNTYGGNPWVFHPDPVELGYIDCKITDALGRVCYATCWLYKYSSGYMFSYVRPYALRADHPWFGESNDKTRGSTPIWTKNH